MLVQIAIVLEYMDGGSLGDLLQKVSLFYLEWTNSPVQPCSCIHCQSCLLTVDTTLCGSMTHPHICLNTQTHSHMLGYQPTYVACILVAFNRILHNHLVQHFLPVNHLTQKTARCVSVQTGEGCP